MFGADYQQAIFKPGDTIFSEGDPGDAVYIIEAGAVDIVTGEGARQSLLASLGPGDIMGEMALIDGGARSASAIACDHCKMVRITPEQFERHLEKSDPVLQMLLETVLDRYRGNMAHFTAETALLKATLQEHGIEIPVAAPEAADEDLLDLEDADLDDLDDLDDLPELNIQRRPTAHRQAVEKLLVTNEIEAALHNGDFELHYQPIIDLQGGHVKGLEALMRWNHPEKGLVPPMQFIPIAESSSLIVEIGRWVMGEAIAAQSRFRTARHAEGQDNPLFVSVNVSGREFASEGFMQALTEAYDRAGCKHGEITLEVTEGTLMQNPPKSAAIMQEAAEAGFSIALDDFGTGYCSYGYLHQWPVHKLKIDRSFVGRMDDDRTSLEIVRSMVNLGHQLGYEVIAEGIEQPEQVLGLRYLGCQQGQGYLFARPAAESEALKLVLGARPWEQSEGDDYAQAM